MGKVTNTEGFAHVQRFVREVYAERLQQAGFSSYKGEGIHWFRLVNNEVVHSIYFIASRVGFPLMMEIGYGCHPLFIPAVLQRSPFLQPINGYEQIYHKIPELIPGSMPRGVQHSFIRGLCNRIYRVPDVLVHCPADDQTSHVIMERILSVLEPIDTPAACYAAHKRWRTCEIENDSWLTMTPYFVDEVLYWNDRELYPYCMRYIEGKREWLESVQQDGKLKQKADRNELAQLIILQDVIRSENRDHYVQGLTERAKKHLAQINKHTNVQTR